MCANDSKTCFCLVIFASTDLILTISPTFKFSGKTDFLTWNSNYTNDLSVTFNIIILSSAS